jgi:hypothetical protein
MEISTIFLKEILFFDEAFFQWMIFLIQPDIG